MILIVITAMTSAPVLARPDKEAARAAFARANRAFDARKYREALVGYRRAHALFPSLKILLNIGITLDVMGRGPEALSCLERFMKEGTSESKKARREARARLEKLKRRLARVRIKDLPGGAGVWVGDRSVDRAQAAQGIYLEPGIHRVSVRRDGSPPQVQEVTLRPGELRDLEARLRPMAGPAGEVKEFRPPRQRAPSPDAGYGRRTTWAYVTLGLGLACVAGASVIYGLGASRGSAAHELYTEATGRSGGGTAEEVTRYREDVESARAMLTGGHVLAGAALVAAGVSIYLFSSRTTRRDQTVSSVGIIPAPSGAALAIGGRF